MRNARLIHLALVSTIASVTSCAAQAVVPTDTTAPMRATASAPPSESVGALSPNEQKRAERARARAVAAAPVSIAGTAPAHDRRDARQSAPPHRHVVVRYADTGASRRDHHANEPPQIAISTRPAKRLAEARYFDRERAPARRRRYPARGRAVRRMPPAGRERTTGKRRWPTRGAPGSIRRTAPSIAPSFDRHHRSSGRITSKEGLKRCLVTHHQAIFGD